MKNSSLFAAFLCCKTESEVKSFLTDLLSKTEVAKAEDRWAIAKTIIATGCAQREAMRRHKATQDQVHRVFCFANRRKSGYRLVYARLAEKQNGDRHDAAEAAKLNSTEAANVPESKT